MTLTLGSGLQQPRMSPTRTVAQTCTTKMQASRETMQTLYFLGLMNTSAHPLGLQELWISQTACFIFLVTTTLVTMTETKAAKEFD